MRSLRFYCCLAVIIVSGWWPSAGYPNALDLTDAEYPTSLRQYIQELKAAHAKDPDNPHLLIQLSSAHLDSGDDLYIEVQKQLEAYQAGADFAKLALELDPNQAQSHFLYAANLGHIAQLKGVLVSALLIREIKGHVEESIRLSPGHAPALHMMGMILDGLPWFLGGDEDRAVSYLERAVAADPNYTHARLNLGKIYLKQGRKADATNQFALVTKTQTPRGAYAWYHRHNPEAERLLQELERQNE